MSYIEFNKDIEEREKYQRKVLYISNSIDIVHNEKMCTILPNQAIKVKGDFVLALTHKGFTNNVIISLQRTNIVISGSILFLFLHRLQLF